ncbi:unnamed protein product [Schistosoma curassoni]|uniref:Uncharacterized protein n=1 Tax=Schistosoma curassoni TaxID=6186 RepID=A0A183KLT5_9TREM|nr:unnamed protein product [Schistosoma curassoni]
MLNNKFNSLLRKYNTAMIINFIISVIRFIWLIRSTVSLYIRLIE